MTSDFWAVACVTLALYYITQSIVPVSMSVLEIGAESVDKQSSFLSQITCIVLQ